MTWVQLLFATSLMVVGGVFIAFNAMILWLTVIRRREAPSAAPIVGGLIASAGVISLPVASSWHWAWVPLLLDWGGLPAFIYYWVLGRRAQE